MNTSKTETDVRGMYFDALRGIAEEHGEDYAFMIAAETIAELLQKVSRAAYRLPDYPIFLPDTPPSTEN